MSEAKQCACASAPKLIFACSGAADVGAVADQTARRLAQEGKGKMYCLTGIGGRINNIMVNAQAAAKILAIDGCALDCAKNCLQQAGFTKFEHLRLGDLGMEKGKTPATEEHIAKAAAKGAELLKC